MFKKIKYLFKTAEINFKKNLLKLSNGKYYKSLKAGVTIYEPSNYNFEKLFNIIKHKKFIMEQNKISILKNKNRRIYRR